MNEEERQKNLLRYIQRANKNLDLWTGEELYENDKKLSLLEKKEELNDKRNSDGFSLLNKRNH